MRTSTAQGQGGVEDQPEVTYGHSEGSALLACLRGQYPPSGRAEDRLLCSGELYNGTLAAPDWRKSDATRSLLTGTLELLVVSQPFDAYPQELILEVPAPMVKDTTPGRGGVPFISIYSPHEEIAQDTAALLTLLLRRLFTVHCQSSERPHGGAARSLPVANVRPSPSWRRRGVAVVRHGDGKTELKSYEVPPLPIDPGWLGRAFLSIAEMPNGDAVLAATRLHAAAMELVEQRPEISYLLLLSAAEAVARVKSQPPPTPEAWQQAKPDLYKRLLEVELPSNVVDELLGLA